MIMNDLNEFRMPEYQVGIQEYNPTSLFPALIPG
jgi:hypothetical protein